jgi:DNA invertase Pin-like site-specific DNA recombinase
VSKSTLVAIYARVSTGEQNPEAQLLALREYVARRGFCIYKEYVDHVSGDLEQRRTRCQNDSAYRELMADAARCVFDCVLVWKYDRFARSLAVLVSALQQFSTLGIDFISYTQHRHDDVQPPLLHPAGRILPQPDLPAPFPDSQAL